MHALLSKYSISEEKNDAFKGRPIDTLQFSRYWNYEDFKKRLQTFKRPMNWFAKPDCIAPIQCAAHGWSNNGNDTLLCHTCKEQLTHSTDDFDGSQLSALLASGHKTDCGWSSDKCPAHFQDIPNASSNEKLCLDYYNRYISLLESFLKPDSTSLTRGKQILLRLSSVRKQAEEEMKLLECLLSPKNTSEDEVIVEFLSEKTAEEQDLLKRLKSAQERVNKQVNIPPALISYNRNASVNSNENNLGNLLVEDSGPLGSKSLFEIIHTSTYFSTNITVENDAQGSNEVSKVDVNSFCALLSVFGWSVVSAPVDSLVSPPGTIEKEKEGTGVTGVATEKTNTNTKEADLLIASTLLQINGSTDETNTNANNTSTPSKTKESVSNGETRVTLHCELCGRHVALKDLVHSPQSPEGSSNTRTFDPITDHRYYCPWVGNSVIPLVVPSAEWSTAMESKGWQVCLRAVARFPCARYWSNVERLGVFRCSGGGSGEGREEVGGGGALLVGRKRRLEETLMMELHPANVFKKIKQMLGEATSSGRSLF